MTDSLSLLRTSCTYGATTVCASKVNEKGGNFVPACAVSWRHSDGGFLSLTLRNSPGRQKTGSSRVDGVGRGTKERKTPGNHDFSNKKMKKNKMRMKRPIDFAPAGAHTHRLARRPNPSADTANFFHLHTSSVTRPAQTNSIKADLQITPSPPTTQAKLLPITTVAAVQVRWSGNLLPQ